MLTQAPAWSVIPDMPRHIPQRAMALHAGAFLRLQCPQRKSISLIHGMNGRLWRLSFMRIPYVSNALPSAFQVRASPSTLAVMSPFSDAPGGTL
jgi:hypothetical protein